MFYVSNYEDITDAQSNQASLTVKAHHDPLTGLSNREQLRSRLAGILESPSRLTGSRRSALLRSGLLPGGERLLRPRRRRRGAPGGCHPDCRHIVRRCGSGPSQRRRVRRRAAARYRHCHRRAGRPERVRDAVAQPLEVGRESLSITMSVGVAAATPAIKPHRLLRNAEVALHRAKNRTRPHGRVPLTDPPAPTCRYLPSRKWRPSPLSDIRFPLDAARWAQAALVSCRRDGEQSRGSGLIRGRLLFRSALVSGRARRM